MLNPDHFKPTPWDSLTFGMNTYEIPSISPTILEEALQNPGHYTVKIDPLHSKTLLHKFGFYYCDTMLDTYCPVERFIYSANENISVTLKTPLNDLIEISQHSFLYDRFHRDFELDNSLADLRYANWLKHLYKADGIFGLKYQDELAGFFAYEDNKLLLAALHKNYQKKGLGKYFWSAVFNELYSRGYSELITFISAANLPILNLYPTLGFRFRNAVDVYHRLVT